MIDINAKLYISILLGMGFAFVQYKNKHTKVTHKHTQHTHYFNLEGLKTCNTDTLTRKRKSM